MWRGFVTGCQGDKGRRGERFERVTISGYKWMELEFNLSGKIVERDIPYHF